MKNLNTALDEKQKELKFTAILVTRFSEVDL